MPYLDGNARHFFGIKEILSGITAGCVFAVGRHHIITGETADQAVHLRGVSAHTACYPGRSAVDDGAGGMVAKDLLLGGKQSDTDRQQRQTEQLLSENEKLRNRNREAERRIEDLMAEIQKLTRKAKDRAVSTDDLEDELADAKRKITKLQQQNDDLMRKVQEYKSACDSYEQELSQLKR